MPTANQRTREILNTFASDIEIILSQLEKDNGSQPMRRLACLNVFNFIEISIKVLRTEFNPHKDSVVRDRKKKFITGNVLYDGRRILRDVPLNIILEDTLALVKHPFHDEAFSFNNFIDLIPVYNRLSYPKTPKELYLTDSETFKMINVFCWLKTAFLTAIEQEQTTALN